MILSLPARCAYRFLCAPCLTRSKLHRLLPLRLCLSRLSLGVINRRVHLLHAKAIDMMLEGTCEFVAVVGRHPLGSAIPQTQLGWDARATVSAFLSGTLSTQQPR